MLSRRGTSWLNSVYRTRLYSYGTFALPERVTFTFDLADVISLQPSNCTFTALSSTPPSAQTPLRDQPGELAPSTRVGL